MLLLLRIEPRTVGRPTYVVATVPTELYEQCNWNCEVEGNSVEGDTACCVFQLGRSQILILIFQCFVFIPVHFKSSDVLSICGASSPFSRLCMVYVTWFSYSHFVLYKNLPRFFGSVILAQLIIFLYAVSVCLTIFLPSLCVFAFHSICLSLSFSLHVGHFLFLYFSSYLSVSRFPV